MSMRGADTIIAVLADRAVRVDKAAGEIFSLAVDRHASTALALSALLKTRPLKRGARVLVLSAEFFTQTVRLPRLQTEGLTREELLSALVFEVEPFSNIPLAQGQAAFTAGEETAGIQLWSVLQIARSEIQTVQAAVLAAGGRVAGLAFADSARLSPLADAELAGALRAVAAAAEAPAPEIPVVRPAAKGLSVKRQELIAGLVFVLVCGACLGHFAAARVRLAGLQAETRRLGELAAANAQIESANASLKARIAAADKARAEREDAEKASARYRQAWRALMRGLLDACDNTVVIQQIEGGGFFDAEISGLSTTEQGPGEFLDRLSKRVGEAGWQIQSERMHTVLSMGGQGPVRFTFHTRVDLPGEARRPGAPAATPDW